MMNLDSYIPNDAELEKAGALIKILKACEKKGVTVSVLGGYGLDGLYGKLTRPHDDIDLMVQTEKEEDLIKILMCLGYQVSEEKEEEIKAFTKNGESYFKIDVVPSKILGKYTSLPNEVFFPKIKNATILGHSFKTPTVEGHKAIIEIQSLRSTQFSFEQYPQNKKENQQAIIAAVK